MALHELATRLGESVCLAWFGLAILARVVWHDAGEDPVSRHRALVGVLVLATLLFGVPWASAPWGASLGGRAVVLDALVVSAGGAPNAGHAWLVTALRISGHGLFFVGLAWLGVVLARLCAIAWRLRQIRGVLQRAALPERPIREALAHEAFLLGVTPPMLRVSREVDVPFVARVQRPVIVVSQTIAEADRTTLGLVLRHELEHVRRRDVATDVAVTLLLALFTLHPAAAALARKIRFAREAAVDARVAPRDPHAYATLLVSMAEHVRTSRVAMDGTDLAARVRRILAMAQRPAVPRRRARHALVFLAFAVIAYGGTALPTVRAASAPRRASSVPAESTGDTHTLAEAVGKLRAPFRACYDQGLHSDPTMVGSTVIATRLGSGGAVIAADAVDTQGLSPTVTACLVEVVRAATIDVPDSRGTTLRIPVRFTQEARHAD